LISVVSLLWFPYSFFAFIDPPQPKRVLPALALKCVYALLAAACLWWASRIYLPQLRKSQSVHQLFRNSLLCVQMTFICATLGLLAFLADAPHLGSPLIILPFVVASAVMNWRFIIPAIVAYQPTEQDIAATIN